MNLMEYKFSGYYRWWVVFSAVSNVVGLLFALLLGSVLPWVFGCLLCFGFYVYKIPIYVGKMPLLIGYANWITLIRLIILLVLLLLSSRLSPLFMAAVIGVVICMDGLDGFLARRFGHANRVGECLDVEVDSFMVLMITFLHVSNHSLNWVILVPGSLKYLYELALSWQKKKQEELLPKRVRSTIAVFFFVSLMIPFLLPKSFYLITYIAGAFIVLSFLISFYSQLKKSTKIENIPTSS